MRLLIMFITAVCVFIFFINLFYLPHKEIIIQWKKIIQINIQDDNEIKKRKLQYNILTMEKQNGEGT